jgi:hypothetical protein
MRISNKESRTAKRRGKQFLFLLTITLVIMIMCQLINNLSYEISSGVFAIIFTILYVANLKYEEG